MSKTTTTAEDQNDDTAGWYITKYDGTLDFQPSYNVFNGSPEIYRTKHEAVTAAFERVRINYDYNDPELVVSNFHDKTEMGCIESIIKTHTGEPVLAVGRVEYSKE